MKVAINGFGRIGRMSLRSLLNYPEIEIVAINDLSDAKTLSHLLKYDSSHGKFPGTTIPDEKALLVNGKKIPLYAEKNPADLPWSELKVDLVVESSGRFTAKDQASLHLQAGAKRVLITAPGTGGVKTIVVGVNEKEIKDEDLILSTASCTTNCIAPVLQILDKELGIENGYMSTIHAFTQDQQLQDGPHKDLRRARAATQSIIPTTTGAAKAIGDVLPGLKGKLDGFSFRVPVIDGSLADLSVVVKKSITAKDLNALLNKYADSSLKGVMEYTEDPLVSVDIINNTHSSIIDSSLTTVIGNTVKVVAWYDNEMGISTRIGELVANHIAKLKTPEPALA